MSLSTVIPAYNSAKYIGETLESVLTQTLPPDEVLVIDDGSTDDTGAIARSFGRSVHVMRTRNSGLSATRNFGAREAKSQWIAFLDADDLWQKDKLERQMAELSKQPDSDVCYTGLVELLDDGRSTRLGNIRPVAPPEKIRDALFHNTNFLSSSVVIRRSTLLASGGFDSGTAVEDWDLWLRLLHSGTKFTACPDPLVQYRIHPESLSHKAITLLDAKEEVYQRLVVPKLPYPTRWIRRNQQTSEHQACAAYVLRKGGDPRCISLMAESILRGPFYEGKRYAVLAYMLYMKLTGKLKALPATEQQ